MIDGIDNFKRTKELIGEIGIGELRESVRKLEGAEEEDKDALETERQQLKDWLRQKASREVYRRAADFGEKLFEKIDPLSGGTFLEGVADFLNNNDSGDFKEKYPDVAKKCFGLSSEQKVIFREIVSNALKDYYSVRPVFSRALSQVNPGVSKLSFAETLSGRLPKSVFASPVNLGLEIFRMARLDEYSSAIPSGRVEAFDRGVFIELRVFNNEDIRVLSGSGKLVAGFFSKKRIFRTGTVSGSAPLVVCDGDKTFEHEKNHYFHSLSQEIISEEEDHFRCLVRLWEIGKTFTGLEERRAKDELADLYGEQLTVLRKIFLRKAKEEILADYRARGDFSHIANLLKTADSWGKEAVYDFYDERFYGKQWQFIPDELKPLIVAEQKLYLDFIAGLDRFMRTFLCLLPSELAKSPDFIKSLWVFLFDLDIANWQAELRINYSLEAGLIERVRKLIESTIDGIVFKHDHGWFIDCLKVAGKKEEADDYSARLGEIKKKASKNYFYKRISSLLFSGLSPLKAFSVVEGEIRELATEIEKINVEISDYYNHGVTDNL